MNCPECGRRAWRRGEREWICDQGHVSQAVPSLQEEPIRLVVGKKRRWYQRKQAA